MAAGRRAAPLVPSFGAASRAARTEGQTQINIPSNQGHPGIDVHTYLKIGLPPVVCHSGTVANE